jgi:chorismate mutase
MNELIILRNKIDTIDDKIIKLLDERMVISKQVGIYKKNNDVVLTHLNRESEIIEKLSKSSSLSTNEISSLYKIIFEISKNKQNINK